MPWNNNQNNGGWKSGNGGPWGQPPGSGGPWGQGPGGGNQQQPDLEEFLKRGQDRFKQVAGGGLPGPLFILLLLIGLSVLAFFAFTYRVNPNQLGIVLQFGKYDRQTGAGLHFRFPYPIEEVLLPDVTRRNTIQIGFRGTPGTSFSGPTSSDVPEESLMLTGDENIVDVDFEVLWQINSLYRDPESGQTGAEMYLFNIQRPEQTVKEVAESAMREVVGKSNLETLLTAGREQVQLAVQELMQKTLDSYRAGILINQVQLANVAAPQKVIAAFRDVQAARADRERLQNEARAYANRVVPEARGQAERILQAAQAYKGQAVAEAEGQAARFSKVYEEYRKAPDVTRQRLFLETMERIFRGTDKIIIDNNSNGSNGGVVPYLPLNELTRPRSPSASANSATGNSSATRGDLQ
ncbi:MAG: FtsH protease activity modulator HflK [Pseudomonadota bacterium]